MASRLLNVEGGGVNSSDDYSDGIRFATEHEVDRKGSFGLRA